MKKRIIFSIVFALLCSGCVANNTENNTETSIISKSENYNDLQNNSLSETILTEEQTTESVSMSQTDITIQKTVTEQIELIPPYDIQNGEPTIQDIVSPWTKESIEAAWNMSWLSKTFSTYFDRCFADIDGDGVDELFLTLPSTMIFIAGYKLVDDEIVYLDTSEFSPPIGKSRFAIPSTDEETISISYNEFQGMIPYTKVMWNMGKNVDDRDFRIMQDSKGNSYFSGYGLSAGNAVCWVIQLKIQDGKLIGEKVYEWGYYQLYNPEFSLMYYSLNDNGKWDITSKQEIDEFLADLR